MNLRLPWLAGMIGLGVVSSAYASDQIIIKFAATTKQLQQSRTSPQAALSLNRQLMQPLSATRLRQISQVSGMNLVDKGPVAIGGRVVQANHDLSDQEMSQVLAKLNAMPGIQYAVENKPVNATGSYTPEPNIYQWDMRESSQVPGVSASYFGDSFYLNGLPSLKGAGVTVAVVDSGYVPHPNFLSQLVSLPGSAESYGYDFISDCRIAGSCPASTPDSMAGRQPTANALDVGDYLSTDEYNQAAPGFKKWCTNPDGSPKYSQFSSWHGTHVTGTIIGQGTTDPNLLSQGVFGGAIQAQVVPVRVIGKCGGLTSDIINGTMWAGGLPVIGVENNPNPAKIINLSLGIPLNCKDMPAYQDAINQLNARGVLIVASAGNESRDVSMNTPASCANVISVAAAGPTDNFAYYSNYGAVTIAAAGGDISINREGGIWSTGYTSTTGFESGNCKDNPACFGYTNMEGTSMAAPHVAAALADIMQSRPNLSFSQARDLLQASANLFATCNLQQTGCVNSGRLNVANLINYVLNDVLVLTPDPNALGFAGNQSNTASFTNSNSAAITIESVEISGPDANHFKISATSCGGHLAPKASCAVTVTPLDLGEGATFAATLVVYNSANQIIAQVGFVPQEPTPTPPSPASSGGGGCSAVANGDDGSLTLILLGVAAMIWLRQRKSHKI